MFVLIACVVAMLTAASSAGAIVNGAPANISARPFQVSLQDAEGHFCGGSILDASTIVTAAHCIEGMTANQITVRAGVTNATDPGGQDRPVVSAVPYPDYAATQVGDVAVLKLASPLVLGGAVTPIALATGAELAAATNGTVSGWGAVSETGDASNQLLQTNVPLVADAVCAAQIGATPAAEVCAGGSGADSCYGDSGGPLTISTPSGERLAGIVSWGEECGGATPGVYAEAPAYASFINGGAANNPVPTTPAPAPAPGDEDPTPAPIDDGSIDDDWSDEDWDDEDWSDEDWGDEDWGDEDWSDEDWGDADFDDEAYDYEDGEFGDGEFGDDDFYADQDFVEGYTDEGYYFYDDGVYCEVYIDGEWFDCNE